MKIISGKISCAKKLVIYGPEGIGKSTFAAQFPEPLFIDTEGSTKELDVARFEKPTSWIMLLEQIRYVKTHPNICKTLVIDTVDWAEAMCVEHVCAKHQKDGLESFGYGNGYVYVKEELGRLLNLLEDIVEAGINVVFTAHAQLKKFEQPDELGSYDRWELKLGKKTGSQTAPLLKEYSDMVLFANYKTLVYNVDGKGSQKGKNKAQGGKRVMYTTHHTSWDAKNRYGLAEELPFDYSEIAHIFCDQSQKLAAPTEKRAVSNSEPVRATKDHYYYHAESDSYWKLGMGEIVPDGANSRITEELSKEDYNERIAEQRNAKSIHTIDKDGKENDVTVGEYNKDCAQAEGYAEKTVKTAPPEQPSTITGQLSSSIPKALRDLMEANGVDEWDIQNVVAAKGYFPPDVPIEKYDETKPGFIAGVLVGAWPQVYAVIKKMKEKDVIVFN